MLASGFGPHPAWATGDGPRHTSALASAPMPSNPLSDPNWAPQLADTIERVVGQVRDKTTKPVIMITRGLVFGLLGLFVGLLAVVVLLIGLLRGFQALIDLSPVAHKTAVWISYLALGGVFCFLGVLSMRKRNSREAS